MVRFSAECFSTMFNLRVLKVLYTYIVTGIFRFKSLLSNFLFLYCSNHIFYSLICFLLELIDMYNRPVISQDFS